MSKKIHDKRKEIRLAIDKANEALQSGRLDSTQRANLERALQSYGLEGDDNGVSIAVGETRKGTVGGTEFASPSILYSETGNSKANIRVTFKDGEKVTAESFAHEGSHVADRQELARAFVQSVGDATANWLYMPENLTLRQAESRAYRVSAAVSQGLGNNFISGNYEVWNSSWKEADRSANMQRGIRQLLNGSDVYRDRLNNRILKEK